MCGGAGSNCATFQNQGSMLNPPARKPSPGPLAWVVNAAMCARCRTPTVCVPLLLRTWCLQVPFSADLSNLQRTREPVRSAACGLVKLTSRHVNEPAHRCQLIGASRCHPATQPPSHPTPQTPQGANDTWPLWDQFSYEAGFSLSGRSADKKQWEGARATCWHDGRSEPSNHRATERASGRGGQVAKATVNTEIKRAHFEDIVA